MKKSKNKFERISRFKPMPKPQFEKVVGGRKYSELSLTGIDRTGPDCLLDVSDVDDI